jgi:cysteine dioxygenase
MSFVMTADDSRARPRPAPGPGSGAAPARAPRPRPPALADFILRLKEAGEPQSNPARVEELLASWRPSLESLRPWIAFDPVRYSRQRLYRDEGFELLLLSWDHGQSTPVHDHDGQAGWITVLEGSLTVQEYQRYGGPADLGDLTSYEPTPPDTVPIVPDRRLTINGGSSIAEAAAPETIHRVAASGGRALSLHLYAGPLRTFLVFDPERGTARRVRP